MNHFDGFGVWTFLDWLLFASLSLSVIGQLGYMMRQSKTIQRLEKHLGYSKVRVVTDFVRGRPVRSESFPVDDGTLPLPLIDANTHNSKLGTPPSTRISDLGER